MSDNAKEDPVNLAESTSTSPVNSTVNPVQIPPATQLPDRKFNQMIFFNLTTSILNYMISKK
jgi:hypothetical protein